MIEQGAFEQFIGAQLGLYHLKQLAAVDYHTPLFLAYAEKSTATSLVCLLIIMTASLLIGLRYLRVRPSKGIIFALVYSLFQGVALGFNSEVVKSFSIQPYMFAAFLFPAIANLFIFLRPKVSELRYDTNLRSVVEF